MNKIPYYGPRGQTQMTNRKIAEEKNIKIINGIIKSKVPSFSYNKQTSPMPDRHEILMENYQASPMGNSQKPTFNEYISEISPGQFKG